GTIQGDEPDPVRVVDVQHSAAREGVDGEVTAQVADEVTEDDALGQAPRAVDAGELVVVPTGDDGLQREVVDLLQDGEVRPGRGGAGGLVDLDHEVGGHVLGPGRPVRVA